MSSIIQDIHNGILTLTFNRPERANALTLAMLGELREAFTHASRDPQTRLILLTGTGKSFCAGHDVGEMQRLNKGPLSYRTHMQATYNPLILQIRRLEKPVVAAINGSLTGAGLGLALACDLRIASQSATFTVGFTGIGLALDSGVSIFLPLLVGLGRATEITFSNAPVSSDQALAWGLVNRIVPDADLKSATAALVENLAAGPIGAFGLVKRAFNQAVLSNLEAVLDYEAQLQEIARKQKEHQEGMSAFLEKRPPDFS